MAFDYTSLAVDALELLTEFGESATLTRNTGGTYNPATGVTVVTGAPETIMAAVFDYPQHLVDGTRVLTGDKQVFAGAVGVTAPTPGDTITWQSVVYTIVTSKPLAPAGTNLLHDVQIRK